MSRGRGKGKRKKKTNLRRQLHHSKHHQTYVNSLNEAEEKYAAALHAGDVTAQIALQPALKFHGGYVSSAQGTSEQASKRTNK